MVFVPDAVEVVERKGRGHPDTITDAIAEAFSQALCRFYLGRFGRILHHNVDKALLVGGAARTAFGGGEVTAPIELHLAGRAVAEVGGVRVPIEEIAVETTRAWLRANLRYLDPVKHVRVTTHVRPGSLALAELAGDPIARAGDTSFGVGHAPFSGLESTVLGVERDLTSDTTLARLPFVGEDVKVMGVRVDDTTELTVAAPLVDRFVADLADYHEKKAALGAWLAARVGPGVAPPVVNAADDGGRVYLTVTGTSAEAGDDGQVGRGNRATGLITPCRPMTLEATAGKNPFNHAGKVYAIAAQQLAEGLVADVAGVEHARVMLVSRIGQRLDEPWLVHVRIATDGRELSGSRGAIEDRVRAALAGLPALTEAIVRGDAPV